MLAFALNRILRIIMNLVEYTPFFDYALAK